MVVMSNYKLGHWYKGKNINGSILIFKVVDKEDAVVTIEIVVDKDDVAFRIEKGNIIYLYKDEPKDRLAKCFTKIIEVSEVEILALIL